MKKYLMISTAALSFCGLFTSCTHDFDDSGYSSAEKSIISTYQEAFVTAFGQPAPTQTWGFGPTSASAVRGGTRTVPGITFPDDFSEKTDIDEPGTIQKPTINKSGAEVYESSQTVQSINSDKTIYVESGVTLTIANPWSDVSLERVNIYLSSGSSLVIANNRNLYLKGNSNIVNDGGTIIVGDKDNRKDIVLENFTGTFWNNGTINYVNELKTSNGDGGNIYLGSSTVLNATKIYLFKNVLFRNEGEITLTSEFNADQYGHKIYNSGTITTPKIILQKETVLWNEGTITAANNKEVESSFYNDDVQIYNGTNATLKLDAMTLTNNRELVINEGTLNVKGKITTQNNSEIVNYKTLTGGEFEMKSGSRFYNVAGGEVTIAGLSKIANDGSGNNKDNVWMNGGQYTTGSFEATGGCQNPAAFNNCHMYVTGKFFMNHSNFVLDGGAAVECGSFEWQSDNYFHMGGKALLKVTGQMLMNNQNNSPQYGFWGDDTDYAVIWAGSIEKGSKGKCRAAYYGNLFIDTDSHFTQGENNADGTWYTFGDNVKFSFTDNTDVSGYQTHGAKTAKKDENFSITIPADAKGCTPGYNTTGGGGGGGGETTTPKIRIICEDLSARNESAGNSDWDFNDVVFDVELAENNITAIVTLLAAGGTLPLTVGWEGDDIDDETYQNYEVHKKFADYNTDKSISTTSMINTGSTGEKYTFRDCNKAYIALPVKQEWINQAASSDPEDILKAVALNIPVKVYKLVGAVRTWVPMEAITGEPAAKIAVGTDYNWCDERTDIRNNFKGSNRNNEYPLFNMFVKGIISESGWYTRTTLTNDEVDSYLNN